MVRLKPVSTATEELENWNFASSKFRYGTFQKANSIGSDQSAPLLFANPEDMFSRVEAHITKSCIKQQQLNTTFAVLEPIFHSFKKCYHIFTK